MSKKITEGLKSWDTTLVGLALAGLDAYNISLQGGCEAGDFSCWGRPVLIAILGLLTQSVKGK